MKPAPICASIFSFVTVANAHSNDLSIPDRGLKFNRTIANAGGVRSKIPDLATAEADIRVQRVADYLWGSVKITLQQPFRGVSAMKR